MKKSNILLISIFSSITLFIISGAIFSVAKGKPEPNKNNLTMSTPPYSHVQLMEANYDVNVKSGDKFELVVWLNKGEEKLALPFETQGDTLILSTIPEALTSKIRYVEMKFPSQDMDFALKTSSVTFNEYLGKSLKLQLDDSEANIYSENMEHISKVDVVCKNQSSFYSLSGIDHLKLEISNSDFTNYGSVKVLEGLAKDSAEVIISSPGVTDFKKDASSIVRYDY
ncbi:hypothetical protein [Flammeovirga sp. SubArs3]|uniref:hypothetical protein n=1 Tax=Flammeovirga sp. SubArs3 TaxID=2995316 RepID=UPI00248C301A|nr:hypothetical protein [Flammeovirga sp. SubArs3]